MGAKTSSNIQKQVLMVGLSGSGKTHFLYETYAFTGNSKDRETRGFNYELLDTEKGKIGVWDIGGNEIMREHWCYFYQNVEFSGVIFMVDASSEESLKNMSENKKLLTHLVNEEELRDIPFVAFFNMKPDKGETTADIVKDVSLNPIFQVAWKLTYRISCNS
eukprot:TRINITY_DN2253_c0_g1_i8.p2 TRINITY_DN2253_c0_g1~~TRINITY_DN2253_c0_g1_i8.p2  ORF type:complete len:162 (-),score=46.22 TRINITY_DN2253_c0_g1_i8:131-616(-)